MISYIVYSLDAEVHGLRRLSSSYRLNEARALAAKGDHRPRLITDVMKISTSHANHLVPQVKPRASMVKANEYLLLYINKAMN